MVRFKFDNVPFKDQPAVEQHYRNARWWYESKGASLAVSGGRSLIAIRRGDYVYSFIRDNSKGTVLVARHSG